MKDSIATQITNKLCHDLNEKYGYSNIECQAYIKGYQDCHSFYWKQNASDLEVHDEPKIYYELEIPNYFVVPSFCNDESCAKKKLCINCKWFVELKDNLGKPLHICRHRTFMDYEACDSSHCYCAYHETKN